MTETWTIDPAHTLVEFAVKHLMISTVKGRFADVAGTIEIDPEHPDRSTVEIEIAAASLDSRVADRDTHLRSADFLEVETYPAITFRSTQVEGAHADAGDAFTITGDLTIKDVTREVVLKAAFEGQIVDPWGNDRLGFSATGKIDRREYGLVWNVAMEAGGLTVGHDVKILIEVEATRAAQGAGTAATGVEAETAVEAAS